jgi:hypothetical protein
MRQRLVHVLNGDELDDASADAATRRFWSIAGPLPAAKNRAPEGCVIDLAQWAQARGHRR